MTARVLPFPGPHERAARRYRRAGAGRLAAQIAAETGLDVDAVATHLAAHGAAEDEPPALRLARLGREAAALAPELSAGGRAHALALADELRRLAATEATGGDGGPLGPRKMRRGRRAPSGPGGPLGTQGRAR